MKKHLTKALALLLSLIMIVSVLPATGLAVDNGDPATFLSGLPADGAYGVIYNINGFVMGYDLTNGKASAKTAELNDDQSGIAALPYGAAVFKFIQTGTDYYMTLGGKYLTIKDLDDNNKEKLVLTDAVETGSKWTFVADQANAEGWWNIKNAEYKYNNKDVYLEEYTPTYGASNFSPYSYKSSTPTLFQMKIAATEPDEDGHVGDVMQNVALPEDGQTYVIYNHYAKAAFGQPTGEDAAAPALLAAAAVLNEDETLDYDCVEDGALIFTVHVTESGSEKIYTFESSGKYLAMPENTVDENGKTNNDETLLMIDMPEEADKKGYAQWKLTAVAGGFVLYNVSARYNTSACCVEYFNEVFSGWTYKSDTPELFAMNFLPMEDRENTGYVVNPSLNIADFDPAIGADCVVKFDVIDVSEPTQITVEYAVAYQDGGDSEPMTAEAALAGRKGSFTVPAAALEDAAALTVSITVTDALGKTYSAEKTKAVRDDPLILEVSPAANSATGDEKRPEISFTFANVKENPSFALQLDGETVVGAVSGNKYVYVPETDLPDGRHSAHAEITRADGHKTETQWSFFVGEITETLYFGQIHAHTSEYSDGAGTLEDAYTHAHDAADVDFIIVTDHSNYFDTTKVNSTASYYDLSTLEMNKANTVTKWEEARATADYFNKQYEDLICMYGYEMTWSRGPGHTNTFNTFGTVSRNNSELNNKTGYAGMHLYNDLMNNAERGLNADGEEAVIQRYGVYNTVMENGTLTVTRDEESKAEAKGVYATKYIPFDEEGQPVPVVSQFNHPGKTFGNFDNFAGYNAKRDDVLNLVEVGNGEGKVGGSAYFPSYEEYDLCLSMGWHVAPTNNQDNHKGNWGDSNSCRDVVLTDDFSEIGIYRALDQRRVYSTEDQNLRIFYTLTANGETYKLGSIAPIDEDDQPESVVVSLEISDPDANDRIEKIEIIGEAGRAIHSVDVNAASYKGEITVPNTEGYYYIRVTEADGQIAVTAPVWVREAVPVSAELESSAAVPAQGEEETITARLSNASETEDLILRSYKIEAEGRVLMSAEDQEEAVAPGQTKVITCPFTPSTTDPPAKQSYEISVTFEVVYKDKTMEITKSLNETSYPPELMTYVALDRGHKNFYVSGDYADTVNSFLKICAERGIICQFLEEGQMTAENLAKYKAVFLTVPFTKGADLPNVWTADELAALQSYANAGGIVVNISKSDRYDPVITLFENRTELQDGDQVMFYQADKGTAVTSQLSGAKLGELAVTIGDADKGIMGENLSFTLSAIPEAEGWYLKAGKDYLGVAVSGKEGEDPKLQLSAAPVVQTPTEEQPELTPADYTAWTLVPAEGGFTLRPRDVEGWVMGYSDGVTLVAESAGASAYQLYVQTGNDFSYSCADISNTVNEALNAQTRFVRGIVVDEVMKDNEAYRVTFKSPELVGDHVFTEGIVPTSNGQYQWYNGTGITVDPCLRFTDVKRSSWYHEAVDFALAHGLMSGTGATTFKPNTVVSREMFVTVLWQLAGKPEPTIENPFTDVKPSNYSYKAILWAKEAGVTAGKTGGKFDRKGSVTRQELATFLYSFAKYKGKDLSGAADLSVYPDGGTVAKWAKEKVQWAVANGLISGVKSGDTVYLKPKNTATRAQMAVILKAFAEKLGEELPMAAGAAVTLIAPYETSWIGSYAADFTGSSYEPDYENDVVMAERGSFSLVTSEKLPGGGLLICGGACFISDYDLKYGDPANTQYENYGMVCNILDYIKDGPFEGEITPIAELHKAAEGEPFTIEGWVTSNASDFDKDTAFFDCIYLQDETRGINAFPVAGYYYIGEKVRLSGVISSYKGEIELSTETIKVVSNELNVLQPKEVTCAEAMADENIGNLLKISGIVTDIHRTEGVIDRIYVDDGSGQEAMLFIDSYIQKDSVVLDKAAVGMHVEGVGLGSRDVNEESTGGEGEQIIGRLRVRSRDEILVWGDALDTTDLEAAIAAAQALDLSLYTADSVAALEEALAAAEAVMADPDKTQRMVTEAANALNAALAALVEIPHGENVFVLATELHAGDQVVIVNRANNIALSSEATGYYNNGVAVTPANGGLKVEDENLIFVVGVEGDYYTFSNNGRKISMGDSYSSMPFDDKHYTWEVTASSNTSGAFYIKNVGRSCYMEWYQKNNYWSGYKSITDEALFAHDLYVMPAG